MARDQTERGQPEILKFMMHQAKRAAQEYLPKKGKVGIREEIDLERKALDAFYNADKMIAGGVSTGDAVRDYIFRRLGIRGLADKRESAELLRGNIDRINAILAGQTGEQILVIDQFQDTTQKGLVYKSPADGNSLIMVARYRGGILIGGKLQFDSKNVRCEIPAKECKGVKGLNELDIGTEDMTINPMTLSDFQERINGENMLICIGRENIDSWANGLTTSYAYYVKEQISRVLPQNPPSV